MEPGLAASRQYDFARRAAPIVGGGALAVSAAFLATHDPGATGSRFPACAFHQITGLWCPGCGLTRGTYQLLHGHVGAALSYNVLTPLALAAIIVVWVGWLRASWGAPPPHVPARTAHWLAVVIPTLLIVYGVLRNIPVAPLSSLAP
jgi:hypothetical protein